MIEGEKIFCLVFIEMQMYGPRQGSNLPFEAEYEIFFETLFICNNVNTNVNENFYAQLSYHSFKSLF